MSNPPFTTPSDPPENERYDTLDECVKQFVTRKEYAWMSDDQKNSLMQDLTTPSVIE